MQLFCSLNGALAQCAQGTWATHFLVALLISTLIVVSIFTGREAIRKYRYMLIRRGARMFQKEDASGQRARKGVGQDETLYDRPEKTPEMPALSRRPHGGDADEMDEISEADLGHYTTTFVFALKKYRRSSTHFGNGWLISCLAYIAITAVGFAYVTTLAFFFSETSPAATITMFTATVTAAFLGGYLFTTSTLIQDLWNFDISPISFLRSCRQIIVAVGLAGMMAAVLHPEPMAAIVKDSSLDHRLFFLIGFISGFVPGFGERYIFAALRRVGAFTKDYDTDAFLVSKIKPLDCIEGIDHWSAYRLELHMIRDVQNLATANPIVLYAETPFDFQQVVDWVGQAQLATVVRSDTYRKLKSIGILSSMDLYGAVVSTGADTHLMQIGQILAEEMAAEKVPGVTDLGQKMDRELVTDWIEHRLSSPHFWRLLELNLRIYEGIEMPFERPLLRHRTRPPEAQ